MTKNQLIECIAERAPQLARRDVERMVNTVFDAMVGALRREQRIEIRGFGSFAVRVRDARQARNPRTGESVRVPRRLTPYFTVGKELRDRLNPANSERLPEDGDATSGPAEGRWVAG
jgi:integration host factor subunit beta